MDKMETFVELGEPTAPSAAPVERVAPAFAEGQMVEVQQKEQDKWDLAHVTRLCGKKGGGFDFDVQLCDSYGTPIQMPQDWSMTLAFVYGDLE